MVLFWENLVVNWLSFSTFKIWLAILSELLLLWMIVGGIVLDYWLKDINCFKPFLVILNSQLFWNYFQKYDRLLFISNPIDAGRKLNIHKTFRRRPGRLLNVLCTFSVRPVSTGNVVSKFLSCLYSLYWLCFILQSPVVQFQIFYKEIIFYWNWFLWLWCYPRISFLFWKFSS